MRAKLYKFLSIFGYQPKLSTETGFVMPEQKELFWRALRKYLLWMVLTCLGAAAAEFALYIIATFYFFYNGTGLFSVDANLAVYCVLMIAPVIGILALHFWMYKNIKNDDSRFGIWHCMLFLTISLIGAAFPLYFGYALLFG